MEAKSVKLYYLTIRGFGEIPRMIFAHTGTPYEQILYDRKTDWPDHKKSFPLHHVPVLELDGVQYPQSHAIWNYLAKMLGLYPSSPRDQMIVDIVESTYSDLTNVTTDFYFLGDGPEKDKAKEDSWPKAERFLNYLEKLLAQAGTGYFVEKRLTLADIVLFDIVTGLNRHVFGPLTPGGIVEVADLKERYPWMARCVDRVLESEGIRAHVEARPPSEF